MNEIFLEGGRNGKHAMELTLILLTLLMRSDLVILISRQCSVSRVYTAAIGGISYKISSTLPSFVIIVCMP